MSFRYKRRETLPAGTRRIVRGQMEQAARALRADEAGLHQGVHDARKCFKRIRAVLRLVRADLGGRYKRENRWFRDSSRSLSGVRDAEALIETCDRLSERHPGPPQGRALEEARAALVRRRDRIVAREGDLAPRAQTLAAELEQRLTALDDWPLDGNGFRALRPGLKRTFKRGRNAMAAAAGSDDDARFHQWRKRVKYHRYHTQLLRGAWPRLMKPRLSALKEISDLLGYDHDLAVLRDTLRTGDEALEDLSPGTCESLSRTARQRQAELRSEALALGRRVYAQPPGCLARELGGWWQAWKAGAR